MAGSAAIASVGKSIERLIEASFEESQPIAEKNTHAVLVRSEDFSKENAVNNIGSPALSVFLYRIGINKTMRAAWSAVGFHDGLAHLALDLHYLISAWAENAEYEHRILGRAMQCLETMPILTGPLLYPSDDWGASEGLQLTMDEVSPEEVMRIFDSLPTDYRLSVPYVARVLRLDSRRAQPDIPVTTAIRGILTPP
jgi:hypothetical protein